MKSRARRIVALLALVAAGGVVGWHIVSDRAAGAGSWSKSDGSDNVASIDAARVRHALWTGAEPLAGEVDTPADETRATLSPDGSKLVFSTGKRGSNAELWIADVHGQRFENARRLDALDTDGDEVAPAFARDALYFASDRPGGAGGLDMYRAPYADGRFGPVERLDAALQSPQDDTDPAPAPVLGSLGSGLIPISPSESKAPSTGDEEIVFASTREGTSHLFAGRVDGDGKWSTRRIDELNGTAEDLEPAFDPEGRFLWFASRRDGNFDLFRAPHVADGFGPVEKLDELDTDADERAPMPFAHGFELFFARPGRGGALDLFRAHSVELARIPAGPWSWIEISTLAGLLLLALLAYLSERWPALDTLYKCYFASLLVHLLLMLWFHHWLLGGSGAPSIERGHKVHVHLEDRAHALTDARVERAGDVSALAQAPAHSPATVSRAPMHALEHALEAPTPMAAQDLRPGEQAAPSGPARAPAEIARTSSIETGEVSDHESHPMPKASASPGLALEPAAQSGAPGTTAHAGAPARARFGHADAGAVSTSEGGSPIDVSRTVGLDAPAMPRESGRVARAGTTAAGDALSDREARSTATASPSPGLALAPQSFAGDPTSRSQTGPARSSFSYAPTAVEQGSIGAIDVTPSLTLDAPAMPRGSGGVGGVGDVAVRGTGASGSDALSDRETHVAGPAQPSPGMALEARSFAADALGASGTGGPARAALHDSPATSTGGASRAIDVAHGVALDAPSMPRSSSGNGLGHDPSGSSPGELADHDALADVGARSAPSAPHPDMLAGLADAAAPASSGPSASGPDRAAFESARDTAPPEQPRPLDIPVTKATDAPLPKAPERSTWKGTPYENRSGPEKERALRDHGGTAETEQAVARGLAYLARIQGERGNWGPLDVSDDKYGRVCVGKTGLATLAFLGAGHTHASNTQYSSVVAAALSFLMSVQDPDSGHFGDAEAYSHGIATYAIAEAYALTHDAELGNALRPAIAHIVAHQSHAADPRLFGGWSYYYADDRVFDKWSRTSITAWQVMALESARLGGIDVPQQVFTDAAKFLESMRDEDNGWYWYNQDPSRMNSGFPTLPASTPAALFALSILGRDITSHAFDVPRAFVVERAPRGFRFTGETDFVTRGQGNPYFWYYGTLAMFRAGGGAWSTWNEAMKKTLLPAQTADGSWNPIDVYAKYARDDENDKSYTTALSVLGLEVYYRYYLPLLKVR